MCLSIEVDRPECVLAKGEHAGFEWVVAHNNFGHRCGYVRVPGGHPWHGKHDSIDAEVHGGLTFSQADKPCGKGDDDAWWLGFDCAHSCDAPDPELLKKSGAHEFGGDTLGKFGEVRSQEYAEAGCRSLCEQAVVEAATCG